MGPAMDQQIIWDLFTNTIEAGQVLGIDDDFREQARGCPVAAAPAADRQARAAHGVGARTSTRPSRATGTCRTSLRLYPGRQITVHGTPELAEAAA